MSETQPAMTNEPETLLDALQAEGEPQTVDSLAARLPGFSREAVAEALDALAVAGVLHRERLPDGSERFHYAKPDAYKLVDTPAVRRPGADFGRR
jgi:predicted transcriptional regulator